MLAVAVVAVAALLPQRANKAGVEEWKMKQEHVRSRKRETRKRRVIKAICQAGDEQTAGITYCTYYKPSHSFSTC